MTTIVSSAPATIDFEVLLVPISAENPSGENQQYSGLYDEIREARRADDTLAQGSWQRELKIADWRQVIDLTVGALKTQTKDLQIGAWLSEGLVKQHGLAGARDGLKLMRCLQESFWETLFPEIDEGDMEARANALEFLDRQLSVAIKNVALTGTNGLTYFKWEESRNYDIPDNLEALEYSQREKFQALQKQADEEKRTTGADWRRAKAGTNRAFYEERFLLLNECSSEFQALDTVMDEKFGRQTPGLNNLKKSLDDVRSLVTKLVEEKRELEPDPIDNTMLETETDDVSQTESPAEAATSNGSSAQGTGLAVNGVIRTRQEALKSLSQVAEYFRRAEPHSPVSYLIQRAVRWGSMPLEGWLQEVIKDKSILEQLRETLGVDGDSPQS